MTTPAATRPAELGALRFAPERQQLERLMATFELECEGLNVLCPRHRRFKKAANCTLHDHVVLKIFGHLVAALPQFLQRLDHRKAWAAPHGFQLPHQILQEVNRRTL